MNSSALLNTKKWLFLPALALLHAAYASSQVTGTDNKPAAPDNNQSEVKMKMTENLNSTIQEGVNALKSMQRSPQVKPVSTVTKLKMDKMNSRYVEQGDQVYDKVSQLTWSRCSLGQHWVAGKGCIGTVRQISFDQAAKFSNEQWRIPTAAELAGLIDRSKKNMPDVLATDSLAFPDMDLDKLYYWSATEENNSFAWAVLFVDGGVPSILYRSHRYAVRFVHTGKF